MLNQLLAAAGMCVKKGSWSTAASLTETAAKLAARSKSNAAVQERIDELNKLIDAEGQRRLQQAAQHAKKNDYAAAFECYVSVQSDFPRRPCAAQAAKALNEATAGNAERKRLLDGIQAKQIDGIIARLLGPADKTKEATRVQRIKAASAARKTRIVAELEKLAKQYPTSDEGKRAAEDLKALRAGGDLQASAG